jgi:Na+/H+ antiporter NhaC
MRDERYAPHRLHGSESSPSAPMRLSVRILVVLVLIGWFVAMPSADGPHDRAHATQLRVREWLLGPDSPLPAWRRDDAIPPLAVEVLPPPTDPTATARAYARIAAEWAAAQTADGRPTRVDTVGAPLPVLVRIGQQGCQAEVPSPVVGAAASTLLLPFAARWSLLPAVVAIAVAVLTQRVLMSLWLACAAGGVAFALAVLPGQRFAAAADFGWSAPLAAPEALVAGTWHFLADAFWRRSVCEDFYLRITAFVVFLFMTVGLITRNGGVQGLVALLQRRVRGPVSAQLATFAAGIAVFFDDYTNCLLVGSSMRPLCDASRVSRQKLAYIVDSTAAPIAGVSVFSTWVTYEMSQYRAPLALVTRADGTPYVPGDAFEVFLATLPFRCYCWFTLALVATTIVLRREFGPMLAAERAARRGVPNGDLPDAASAMPAHPRARARNAIAPLLVLVVGTVGTMIAIGWHAAAKLPETAAFGERVRTVLANSRSDWALLGAAATAWLVALGLTAVQRLLSVREVMATCVAAMRPLGGAFGILFLAWSLGHLCKDLGTSFFLTTAIRDALSPWALPTVLFVVAASIAFATGTSFGTMAILLPNVVVLAHQTGTEGAFTGDPAAGGPALMLLCLGAVMEGAIFGDHCSPISDTTVLSSIGSRCGLIDHVQTQFPYALLAFTATIACGYLPLAFFGPQIWPLALLGGVGAMALALRWLGRDPGA